MSEEKKDQVLNKEKELDESELDAVAGGTCGCAIGGGGKGYDEEGDGKYTCGCALAGVGIDEKDDVHCGCPLAGAGTDHYNS